MHDGERRDQPGQLAGAEKMVVRGGAPAELALGTRNVSIIRKPPGASCATSSGILARSR